MAQAPDVVLNLGSNVGHEGGVESGVGGAGKHEVLPDTDSEPVANIEEGVIFVDAAAPGAEHLDPRAAGELQKMFIFGRIALQALQGPCNRRSIDIRPFPPCCY